MESDRPGSSSTRPRPRLADHYDAELARHNHRLRAATAIGPADRVLDVGCGGGQTTREAARAAASGSALGVDISEAMIERARRITAAEGPRNVAYELGDAQSHPFAPASFDVIISRFGTMFFADLAAAFANLARAARPGGRLVMLAWQGRDRNEWAHAIADALVPGWAAPPPQPGMDPFSLADPATVESLLAAAGWRDVGFADVHEPVYYGPDVPYAYDIVCDMRMTSELLAAMDAAAAEQARSRLRQLLAEHQTGDGVLLDSRAWIVTAAVR